MRKPSLLIVGPLISQHIQAWYTKFNNASGLNFNIFTLHDGGVDFNHKAKKSSFSLFKNKLDFFVFLPVFIIKWWFIRPNVTNFHYLSSYGLYSLFIPKKNLILNTWGSDVNLVYTSNSRLKKIIIKLALRRFSWINTPAVHLKEKLIELGADRNKIEVFQYGINVDYDVVPRKEKLKGDPITFVSNRNWQDLYNIDSIVAGFAKFKKENSVNARLLVYGRGSKEEESVIKNVLHNYDPDVVLSIVFMGYVRKEDMLNQMQNNDIYISIPSRDGTPLSLLEAMYLGLYPIVSNIDANHEWLDRENGTFIDDTSNIAAIADSMRRSVETIYSQDMSFVKINSDVVKSKANMAVNTPRFHSKINEYIEKRKK